MRQILTQAEHDSKDVMTGTPGAARILGLSEGHLRNLRNKKVGPPFYKYGKTVRYSIPECEAWKAAQRVIL